jgi:DNA polymerase elongation subunit (family B)
MKIENREDFIKFKNSFKKTINKVTETINDITIFYEKECVTLPLNCKKWVYENYKNTENDLIFGKNNTYKIVNISYKNGKLHIFRELENEILETSTNFKWWLIADVIHNGNFEVLKGNQPLRYLKFFDNRTTFQQANNRLFQLEAKKVRTSDEIEQSLLMDGYTYFKNLKLNDVSILSFDIETTTINPENNEALVLLISNTFRKKDKIVKKLFSLDDFKNELDMILSWCEWVRDVDPSFIVGHNIYSFDLNYLNKRLQICNNTQISEKLNGSNLPLGRDGSPIRISTRPSLFRYDGSQKYEFFNIIIFGREIIDTWFLSMKYDVSRDFPNYKLKDIIKYLNLEKENRIKWDFEKNRPLDIFKNLNRIESKKIWEDFKEYCIDDSDDALKLFDIMAPSFFYTNQAIPKTFQKLLVTATGSWINSFLIRSYLKDGFSIPNPSESQKVNGGISFGVPGVYHNVKKIDAKSLYPSIILQYKIGNNRKRKCRDKSAE